MAHLRPEAMPVTYKKLDSEQKEAFETIVRYIENAIDHLEDSSVEDETGGDLLESRAHINRAVFLSGDRGTGKTTVMATIINESLIHRNSSNAEINLKKLNERVIWLEPIDMETVPDSTNILGAILARIEKSLMIQGSDRLKRGGGNSALMELNTGYPDAMLMLDRLQVKLALAWEGNIKARSSALDPDAFAVELKRAEHARLSVNSDLATVLLKLGRNAINNKSVYDPIFVLPVDDFDLNPKLCIDLLKLLRMISVPRLFAIVIGDFKIAEIIMKLKVFAGFQELMPAGETFDWLQKEINKEGGQIAANALRKLLPPNQRIHLEGMSPTEALEFTPIGTEKTETLINFLKLVPIKFGRPKGENCIAGLSIQNLKDFLLVQPMSIFEPRSPEEKEKKLEEAYWGRSLFATTPRRIADIWLELKRFTAEIQKQGGKINTGERLKREFMDYFAGYARLAVGEEITLNPYTRQTLIAGISKREGGNWNLEDMSITIMALKRRAYEIEIGSAKEKLRGILKLNAHSGWQLLASSDSETDRSTPDKLSQQAGAAIILLHDLLSLDPAVKDFQSPFLYEDPSKSNIFESWARVSWYREKEKPLEAHWPAPPCKSFWQVDIFLGTWRDLIDSARKEKISTPGANLDVFAFTWLSAGTAIVDNQPMVKIKSRQSPVESRFWKQLSDRLKQLTIVALETGDAAEDADKWLIRIALLMMPETGFPDINEFKLPIELKEYWREKKSVIQQKRSERLKYLAPVLTSYQVNKMKRQGEKRIGFVSTPPGKRTK